MDIKVENRFRNSEGDNGDLNADLMVKGPFHFLKRGECKMGSEIWKVYGITEDEHIEYCRCLEKLENLGFEKIEVDKKLLNCNTCILCGSCTVSRENMFLGAKTC